MHPSIIVTPPEQYLYNPLGGLSDIEGREAFQLFREGGVLTLWRWSTPHQWSLEHEDGRTLDFSRAGESGIAGALRTLGKKTHTEGVIPRHDFAGVDVGKPGKECWMFDEALYLKALNIWEKAALCAQEWNQVQAHAIEPIETLSDMAKATLRLIVRKKSLAMYPELHETYLELARRRLIKVHPEGFATLRDLAKPPKLNDERVLLVEFRCTPRIAPELCA